MKPRPRHALRLSRRAAVLLVGALLLAAPEGGTRAARASILVALDLPELVRQSQHIAVVEVTSVQSAWDERHERIFSTIELKVVESWKAGAPVSGMASDRLTIVQPGGTVGDINMKVTGLGSFAQGERTLVFLRGPANRAQVVGMTQGKRTVRLDASSKRWMVAPPDLRSATLVKAPVAPGTPATPTLPSGGPSNRVSSSPVAPATPSLRTSPPTARELPLDEFRAEVKRLLEARNP